jgi:hypothetical protein
MTVKKTQGAYVDCVRAYEAALKHGEISITFDTYGAAVNFRQRCYRLRNLLLEAHKPGPGMLPETRYDSIVLQLPRKHEPDCNTLTLRNRSLDADDIAGRIRTADGAPVLSEDGDLDEAVRELRGRLGLE